MSRIRRIAERLVYENRFVRVYDDEVVFPSGAEGTYVRVEPAPAGDGVVLVVRHAGRTAFVETFRYPIGRSQLAFPRGFGHGPDVLASAHAEAYEELGVRLESAEVIGHLTPDSGLLSTRAAVVLARAVDEGVGRVDTDEVSAVRWLAPEDVDALVRSGGVDDGFTLAALTLVRARA